MILLTKFSLDISIKVFIKQIRPVLKTEWATKAANCSLKIRQSVPPVVIGASNQGLIVAAYCTG